MDRGDQNALEALDRVLEELRREFAANPEFAHRVVRALGANVVFGSAQAAKLLNPVELVANKPEAEIDATLDSLTPADLKKVANGAKLATTSDMSGLSKPDLIALIKRRATARLDARRSDA